MCLPGRHRIRTGRNSCANSRLPCIHKRDFVGPATGAIFRMPNPLRIALVTAIALVFGNGGFLRAEDAEATVYTQQAEVMPAKGRPAPRQMEEGWTDRVWEAGPQPEWIWMDGLPQKCVLKTTFSGGSQVARVRATADNAVTLYLNGKQIGSSDEWKYCFDVDIQPHLVDGENELVALAENRDGIAAFVCKVVMQMSDGTSRYVVSNGDWKAATERDAQEWQSAKVIHKYGAGPWGRPLSVLESDASRNEFELLPGFQVERLFTVPKDELGSWVCITTDPLGRLLVSDQGGQGICRVTIAPVESTGAVAANPEGEAVKTTGDLVTVEKLPLDISAAQGMLHAFGHLYLSVNGGKGSGLYRAKYLEESDSYGPVEKLVAFRGGGEHGPHALRLSPDGESIYVIAGNHTQPPFKAGEDEMSDAFRSRIPSNWDEDLLLPRMWDANGHARGVLAPGGWIAKTDPQGKTWEIISIGYRNPYDMAFNADGELFAYDADMEWDMGAPWYRPTRVVHATSGSEFGWRSGTGKWPDYYLDSLPAVVDVGPGSPVGVEFGYGTKFPAKYQKALYILDWTFGTMYAIHLQPEGATYTATKEEFLSRTPLPLTDATVGADGALYFTVGGRGTQSELFRVTYIGDESTEPADLHDVEFAEERARRRAIERLHTAQPMLQLDDPEVNQAFRNLVQSLASEDRFVRYAATIAGQWIAKYAIAGGHDLEEVKPGEDPRTIFAAAVINARVGGERSEQKVLPALIEMDINALAPAEQLDYLRALSLLFIRKGEPAEEVRAQLLAKLEPLYPAPVKHPRRWDLNNELVQMLVYLQSDTVVSKAIELLQEPSGVKDDDLGDLLARNSGYGRSIQRMLENQPDKPRVWAAFVLRNAKEGWTPDLRKQYFAFMKEAHTWSGGNSYQKFLTNIKDEMFVAMPNAEQLLIEHAGLRNAFKAPELPLPAGPGKDRTVADVVALVEQGLKPRSRSYSHGETMYKAARCVMCHRFGGDGGSTGPDLTQLAGRFNIKDLTEAIVDPAKVISDQYKASTVVTTDGEVLNGRVLTETDEVVVILTDPEDSSKITELKRSDVELIKPSEQSLMPTDLLKPLNDEEVLDLMAYLLSRGNPRDEMFRREKDQK